MHGFAFRRKRKGELLVSWSCRFSGRLSGGRARWSFQVSLAQSLVLQLGMVVFFLVYNFLFTLGFDRVFGLPESALVRARPRLVRRGRGGWRRRQSRG
ncbi:hypothetical protein IV102_05915 [bacterium]|nr:hypothetical protein [bacterium]